MRRRRIPTNLRAFTQAYELDEWVEQDCPIESCYSYLDLVAPRVDAEDFRSADGADNFLVGLVAAYLNQEGSLEDYVFGFDPPPSEIDHDLTKPGAMTPICEAAAFLIVREYRVAMDDESRTAPTLEEEA